MAYQDFLIDKRILQRNLDKGLVDGKTFDKLLAGLPDRADNATSASLEAERDELDDVADEDEDEDEDEGAETADAGG
jgi:hypothetical protein